MASIGYGPPMATDEFPVPDGPIESVDPAVLRDRIEFRGSVHLLDVRAEDDVDEWWIQGEAVQAATVPTPVTSD